MPAVKTTAAPSGRDTTLPLAVSSPSSVARGSARGGLGGGGRGEQRRLARVGGHEVSARVSVRSALSCAALRSALRSGGGDDQYAAGRVGPDGSVSNVVVEVEQVGKKKREGDDQQCHDDHGGEHGPNLIARSTR